MGVVKKGHAIAALVLGAIEAIFGIIIIACSFALGGKLGNASTTLTPYWAGIPYLIPGILGIVTGITKNSCAMIAFMVLNIICFVLDGVASVLILIVIGIWAAIVDAITNNCEYKYGYCKCVHKGITYNYKVDSCDTLKTIVALLWCIVIFAIMASIVSLAGSIVGCCATCCKSETTTTTVIVQQPGVVMQPQQPQPMMEKPPAY